MQNRKIEVSAEVVAESLRLARANQVPGQSKEQTQLIAQGIQKGIAEYKRALKARQRLAEKAKKQLRRQTNTLVTDATNDEPTEPAGVVCDQWIARADAMIQPMNVVR